MMIDLFDTLPPHLLLLVREAIRQGYSQTLNLRALPEEVVARRITAIKENLIGLKAAFPNLRLETYPIIKLFYGGITFTIAQAEKIPPSRLPTAETLFTEHPIPTDIEYGLWHGLAARRTPMPIFLFLTASTKETKKLACEPLDEVLSRLFSKRKCVA